ncbi:MAG: hypothetical protein GX032_00585 [Tenericutes bacterium]|jgi:hypothetical protein|nr:hypothetical protein [Bacilli bacterium]MDD3995544.1 hypothetical protein [Bacilli bacterium]MDD4624230.1 hypothetical protein [Bacilli bacterium]NLV89964.1 hypothetical protein [Mycoplasmatota bacterium]
MGNLGFKLKKFFQNKNTVTILGVVLGVLIIFFGYNYRVNQAIQPVDIPYAKVSIQPRTKITEDMIGIAQVPPAMVKGKVIKNPNLIVGKWSNYNAYIPFGSMFYEDNIITESRLPDSAFINIRDGFTAFNLPVDVDLTYGNSMFPDNFIDIYLKALDPDGKVIYGKLVENVKILAVKDNSGEHVFENSEQTRRPSILLFAVPEDIHLLLRKALYLQNVRTIAAELVPVPTTQSYKSGNKENLTPIISNQELKLFLEINTGLITEDQLPDVIPEEQ